MSTNNIDNSRRKFLTTLSLATTASLLIPSNSFPSTSSITKKALSLTTNLKLPTDSNCEVIAVGSTKVEVRFPYGKGYLKPGRSVFRDEDDLINYLSEAFLMEKDERGGVRGTVRCVSAYERINEKGRAIFSFEDPILDLITDEEGNLTISGVRVNAKDIVLANDRQSLPVDRIGLTNGTTDKKLNNLVSKASFTAAQSIPSEINIPSSSTIPRIRFKAYIDIVSKVWKAGANIKTKKLDFVSASIKGHYALDPISCLEVKTDFDSDTTDNFLNEFEFGVNSPPASGVRSECKALWNGTNLSEVVAKGCFV